MSPLIVFAAAFALIGIKALQQRNVTWNSYWMVPPASYGMALADMYLIWIIAQAGPSFATWFALGTGGWMGCYAGMYVHNRWGNNGPGKRSR